MLSLLLPWQALAADDLPTARGALNLAEISFEDGDFDEAIKYLESAPKGTELDARIITLLSEAMIETGNFEGAVGLLESDRAKNIPNLKEFLIAAYLDWSFVLYSDEETDEARAVLARGLKRYPDDPELLADSRSFDFMDSAKNHVRDNDAENTSFLLASPAAKPKEKFWYAVCPPQGEIVDRDCSQWMPDEFQDLEESNKILYAKFSKDELKEFNKLSADYGFKVEQTADLIKLSKNDYFIYQNVEKLLASAAADGYGMAGSAYALIARTQNDFSLRSDFFNWINANKNDMDVVKHNDYVSIVNKETKRSIDLYVDSWGQNLRYTPEEWQKLWNSVTSELARQGRPFVCFCGKNLILRESYNLKGPVIGGAPKKGDFELAVNATCGDHWLIVTPALLADWKITKVELNKEVEKQALEIPWEIGFERMHRGDDDFLVLNGTGVGALSSYPGVLLNVLELLDGEKMGGQTVKLWTPYSDYLVVSSQKAKDLDDIGILKAPDRQGGFYGPLSIRKNITLPPKAMGKVNLTPLN